MIEKKSARKAHAMRGELYRSLVLEAAEQEFAAHGFNDARVQRVADSVGLSVGTLYNLFESKEGLYGELLRLRGNALTQLLMESLQLDAPVPERLANSVRVLVQFTAEYPRYMRMVFQRGHAWSNQRSHPHSDQHFVESAVDFATQLVAQAIDRGEMVRDDPRRIILTMTAVLQAQVESWMDSGMAESTGVITSRITDLFARMYRR